METLKMTDPTHALRVAITGNYPADRVIEILEKGADPNDRLDGDYSFLQLAIENQNTDVAIALLDHGADPHQTGFMSSPLLKAIHMSNTRVAEALLEHNVDPNREVAGLVPIHVAIRKGDPDAVDLLIKYGANLDSRQGGLNVLGSLFHRFYYSNETEIAAKRAVLDILTKDETQRQAVENKKGLLASLVKRKSEALVNKDGGYTPAQRQKAVEMNEPVMRFINYLKSFRAGGE